MTEKNALVCDDDRIMQNVVSHLLARKGFSVEVADDGEKGLAAIEEHSPSLLILDMDMPRMTGLELLEKLRGKSGAAPYIIFLSAHEDALTQAQALKLGAGEVLVKPFNPAELLRKIDKLLEQGKI